MDDIKFIFLSEEEEREVGTYDEFHVTGAAINKDNECVSISTQTWSETRNRFCEECTQHCSWGGIVWTRQDFRRQGIFTNLYYWVKDLAGIDRIYVSKTWELHKVLADRYDLHYPKYRSLLISRAKTKSDLDVAVDLAERITTMVQAKGGVW